jgi:hypothetical protein
MGKPSIITSGLTAKFLPCKKGEILLMVEKEPVTITIYHNGKGRTWILPIGFVSNLKSSPKWARWYVPKWDETYIVDMLHDYLYTYHLTTRKESDKIYRLGLHALGIRWTKRNIMYSAVRIGGKSSWKKEKQDG